MMTSQLSVVTVSIMDVSGTIQSVHVDDVPILSVMMDLPDGEYIKILHSGGTDQEHGYFTLGVVYPDGTVSCVMVDFHDQWRWMGNWYGYADCCIDEFITGPVEQHHHELLGSGLVVCGSCVDKSSGEIVKALTAKRQAPNPFLMEGNEVANMCAIIEKLITEEKEYDC